jgi:hypothetical protein
MERCRVRHLLLDEVLRVLGRLEIEPARRRQAPILDRVSVRIGERDELIGLLEVGERQLGEEPHRLARGLDAVGEHRRHRRQLCA